MSFALHGKYCGPGWSAGKYQLSVAQGPRPVDDFDASCARHDAVYAVGGDLSKADQEFFWDNIGKGVIRSYAGMAVGLQGIARTMIGNPEKGSSHFILKKMPPPTPAKTPKRRRLSAGDSSSAGPSMTIRRGRIVQRTKSMRKKVVRGSKKKRRNNRKRKGKGKKTKGQKASAKNIDAKGARIKYEDGNVFNSRQCVYFCHGMAPYRAIRVFMFAIVKKLFKMHGVEILEWNDYIRVTAVTQKIGYFWVATANQNNQLEASVDAYDSVASRPRTYAEFADAWLAALQGVMSDTNEEYPIGCELNDANVSTSSKINLAEYTYTLGYSSSVKLQNRTIASTAVGEGTNTSDNIRANPLVFKIYKNKYPTNMLMKRNRSIDTAVTPFNKEGFGVGNNGFKIIGYGTVGSSNVLQDISPTLKKLPPAYYFNAKSAGGAIQPGDMMVEKTRYKGEFTHRRLFKTFQKYFDNTSITDPSAYALNGAGSIHVVGFEHALDTRVDEPNISLGYQTDQQYYCILTKKVSRVPPQVVCNDSPQTF